jgi:hypothetical protein
MVTGPGNGASSSLTGNRVVLALITRMCFRSMAISGTGAGNGPISKRVDE